MLKGLISLSSRGAPASPVRPSQLLTRSPTPSAFKVVAPIPPAPAPAPAQPAKAGAARQSSAAPARSAAPALAQVTPPPVPDGNEDKLDILSEKWLGLDGVMRKLVKLFGKVRGGCGVPTDCFCRQRDLYPVLNICRTPVRSPLSCCMAFLPAEKRA